MIYKVKLELKTGSKYTFRIRENETQLDRVLELIDKAWKDDLSGYVEFNGRFFDISSIVMYSVKKLRWYWPF